MSRKLGILAIILGLAVSAQAEISLEPSALALSPQPTIQYQVEQGSGFSEVKQEREKIRKRPWQAFLMSLVVPGTGELYAGAVVKSRIFMAAEIGGLASLISFRHLGQWREDDYRNYAAREAGADVEGKDERFFDVLGFYSSREEYNKVGGAFDPAREYYPDTEAYFWRWSSADARNRYRDLKNDSKSFYRNADFALGFLIANHVLSAVDAYWSVKRHNRGIESGFSGIELEPREDGWQITLHGRF